MRLQVLFHLMVSDLKLFARARVAMFWTFAFPLLLLLMQMALFGHSSSLGPVSFSIIDHDTSDESIAYAQHLRSGLTHQKSVRFDLLSAEEGGVDTDNKSDIRSGNKSYIKPDFLLTIPEGFASNIARQKETVIGLTTNLKEGAAYDASYGLLRALSNEYNLHAILTPQRVTLQVPVRSEPKLAYGLYLVTGLTGMIILSSSLMGFAGSLVAAREGGMFRLYQLFPMKTAIVVVAWWLSRLLVTLGASILMLVVARLLYDIHIDASGGGMLLALFMLCLGTGAFLAIGMLIAAICPNVASVTMICNVLYFPLMFASNLMIPLDTLPKVLRDILGLLPLNAMVDAIRSCLSNQLNMHMIGYSAMASLLTMGVGLAFSVKYFTWVPRG
ncbi:ABC transporter permease [Undibacterium sp. SXout11W]|uniref:ABC transporter permease n=1 Tax=Undibacterium sp. SXout11W TaxID=3413050 RepID=UPI003BF21B11